MNRADKKQVLVDHYFDFYATALSILEDEDDARDAVQDALVSTLVQRGVKDPLSYCQQSVRNRCVDFLRRRGQMRKLDEREVVVDPEREELLKLVAEKRRELPSLWRTIVEMHYEDGRSIPEVAEKLGISVSKVKRTLVEIKSVMKTKLELE